MSITDQATFSSKDAVFVLGERAPGRAREIIHAARKFNFAAAVQEAEALLALGRMENDTLKKLRLMARAQNAFESAAVALGELSKELNNAAIDLGAHVIPEIMDEAGIDHFGLTEGHKVVIEEKVHASLKKENNEKGCDWLEANGFQALVKRTLTVPFTTKQHKLADKVRKAVEKALGAEAAMMVKDERTVHHSTLSAWAREQLRNGEVFPMDIFGAHRARVAKITEK